MIKSLVAGVAIATVLGLGTQVPSAQAAFPQTKPKAGQLCKKVHRGVVAKTTKGTKVRCVKQGTRSRWVNAPMSAKVTPLAKVRRLG